MNNQTQVKNTRARLKIFVLIFSGALLFFVLYLLTMGKVEVSQHKEDHIPPIASTTQTDQHTNDSLVKPGGTSTPTISPLPLPPPAPTKEPAQVSPVSGMRLTFQEEFDTFSTYVDPQGNITCNPGGNGRWQTVYHFCSRTIASNSESEVYIDQNFLTYLNSRSATPTTARNPFSISNSILRIEAAPTDEVIRKAAGQWAKYTSGLITTQFSFAQQYGYFEMRAKLPAGRGLWPAFWLLPIDKSWPPEVDAMEAFGDKSTDGQGGRTQIHYGSHSQKKSESCGGWHDVGVDITQDFHTYGVLVEPAGMTYYFDGGAYATCPANSGTNQPFYMLVNLATGGPGSWPGVPDASTIWPAYMSVDYVRAYQKI